MRACGECDRLIRPRGSRADEHPGTVEHAGRGLCRWCWRHSDIRADYSPEAWPGPELLAEVRAMVGRSPAEVATAVGRKPTSIARAARRWGAPEIAVRYERAARGTR